MKKTTNRWIALVAMSLGVFMGLLDVTVVNVALPSMAVDFKTTFSNLQWVLNAYTLMYAVSLLIVSKLGGHVWPEENFYYEYDFIHGRFCR